MRAFARSTRRDAAQVADGRPDAGFIAFSPAYVSSAMPQRSRTARRASPSSGVPTFDSPSAQRMGSRRAPRALGRGMTIESTGLTRSGCQDGSPSTPNERQAAASDSHGAAMVRFAIFSFSSACCAVRAEIRHKSPMGGRMPGLSHLAQPTCRVRCLSAAGLLAERLRAAECRLLTLRVLNEWAAEEHRELWVAG